MSDSQDVRLRTDVLTRVDEIEALLPEWVALHAADTHSTAWTAPYLTLAFHAMMKRPTRPFVVCVRAKDGALAGLLPLGISRGREGPVWLRRLVSLTGSHACYPDAAIAPGQGTAVMQAIGTCVAGGPWDELRLNRVRPDGHLVHAGWPTQGLADAPPSDDVPLWSVNPAQGLAHMSVAAHREVRRRYRRLCESGTISIGWETPDTVTNAVHEFIALHTALKREQRQWATFESGPIAARFPGVVRSEMAERRADMFSIRRDGELLAAKIIWRHRDRSYAYRTAWNPALPTFGLGVLVMTRALEACRDRGDACFDFGPGHESYKATWTVSEASARSLIGRRATLRNGLVAQWRRLKIISRPATADDPTA